MNAANPDAVSWSLDLSGGIQRVAIEHGCSPYGNGKARMIAWNLPDPIPVHREVIYTSRPDLVGKYPTLPDARQFRVPNIGFTRPKIRCRQGHRQAVPAYPEFGPACRIRRRRRGDAFQQVARRIEAGHVRRDQSGGRIARGIKDGGWVWVTGAESNSRTRVKAFVTERVGKGVAWMPYHFAGWYEGADLRSKYPKGADPIVLGESVNTLTTYGYDPATGMQEPKATLCRDQGGVREERPWLA